MENCAVNIENISYSKCTGDYGMVTGVLLHSVSTTVSDANALLKATWDGYLTAAQSERLYIPIYENTEATREKNDANIKTTNTGFKIKTAEGSISFVFDIQNPTICQANKLKSFDGAKMFAWFTTLNGAILCSGTGSNNKNIPVRCWVDDYVPAENETETGYVRFRVDVLPRTGNFTKAILPAMLTTNSWLPSELEPVADVDLSVVSSSSAGNTLVIDVVTDCDSTEVTDIVTAADFVVEVVSTGVTQAPSGISAVGNRYTLTVAVTGATDYYVYMKTADNQTDKKYETNQNGVLYKLQFTAGA